jgi:hypothetical protein
MSSMERYSEALEDIAVEVVDDARKAVDRKKVPRQIKEIDKLEVASMAYAIATNRVKSGQYDYPREEIFEAIKDLLDTPTEDDERKIYLDHLLSKND